MRKTAFLLASMGLGLFLPLNAQPAVTVTPSAVSVHLGTFFQFTARVTGTTTTTVGWTVALPSGATGSPGTISAGGRYTPPAAIPSTGTVIVTATTTAQPPASASATVTLLNFYPTLASAWPSTMPQGNFLMAANGSGFVPGSQILFGGAPLPTTFVSATKLMATGTASQNGSFRIQVANPDPGAASSDDVVSVVVGDPGPPIITGDIAARFLERAAFGPDADTVAHVQRVGLAGYLQEQFTAPISPYPDPDTTAYFNNQVQARFFSNAVHGQDQLRQRVAFALGQILVVSAVVEQTPAQLVSYLRILHNDAFGNFRKLMEDVTLSPTMGEYLNMVNNDKADPTRGTRANENYARELMQLFSIGLFQLNQDGTLRLDEKGNAIPTYDQTTIQEFSKVYTGWTYPTRPGATLQRHNPAYYAGPMVPFAANHDTTSKVLLNGLKVPAGLSPADDLKMALDNVFNHPNVGPFIGKQLIEHLVTSNPSPAYVARVAAAFNDDGSAAHVRGNMQAVIAAILLDREAMEASAPFFGEVGTQGHLREPALVIASILRGLGAQVNDTNTLNGLSNALGQNLFTPPTVFNYFAPGFQVPVQFTPGNTLLGPEFQILSPSNAVARINMVNSMIYGNLGAGAVIDLTAFAAPAGNPQALVDLISQQFFYWQMPLTMQKEIINAVNALPGTTAAILRQRAQAALYVALSSSYYNVEH